MRFRLKSSDTGILVQIPPLPPLLSHKGGHSSPPFHLQDFVSAHQASQRWLITTMGLVSVSNVQSYINPASIQSRECSHLGLGKGTHIIGVTATPHGAPSITTDRARRTTAPCRTPSSRRDGAVALACDVVIVAWRSTVHAARSTVRTTRDSPASIIAAITCEFSHRNGAATVLEKHLQDPKVCTYLVNRWRDALRSINFHYLEVIAIDTSTGSAPRKPLSSLPYSRVIMMVLK
ncbi:hypothetical protein EV401DRAFT_1517118 [Pisolithus croceorrhizus]|nr:hypothetical protein EV401DRAFT_1517118 [Pisolithus croceorrhizus]